MFGLKNVEERKWKWESYPTRRVAMLEFASWGRQQVELNGWSQVPIGGVQLQTANREGSLMWPLVEEMELLMVAHNPRMGGAWVPPTLLRACLFGVPALGLVRGTLFNAGQGKLEPLPLTTAGTQALTVQCAP